MMVFLIIYVTVSIVLGGVAAAIEIRRLPTTVQRPNGETFVPRKINPIWFGLFVTMFWPLLLIGVLL